MTYFAKQTQLISHKLLHPNLKLISDPFLRGSHHLYIKNKVGRCGQVTYKSDDNQTGMTYKSLILSHLTYKSGDLGGVWFSSPRTFSSPWDFLKKILKKVLLRTFSKKFQKSPTLFGLLGTFSSPNTKKSLEPNTP